MLFSGYNRHLESIKNPDYLKPIRFAAKGDITGIIKLESKQLQAGTIQISENGDVSGVRDLHAKGSIKTDGTLQLPEFSTGGKVQSAGPVVTAASGYVNYCGVGLTDPEYGKLDPYFSRKYSCILPDTYPPQVYIWSLTSDTVTHLTITQGNKTYVYVFPIGRYTSADICYTFNHTLQTSGQQIPLVMSYDTASDRFTITVDENIGAINEPPPYLDTTPSYKEEFTILGKSLLLQRLGFVSADNTAIGILCSDITSVSRVLRSTVQTAFKEVAGYSQGYYTGGVKNNDLSSYWSPATHVWVGPQPSQTCKYKVLKTMNESRMASRVGNECFECETLLETALFRLSATITSPYFNCTDEDTPWVWETVSSDIRENYLPIYSISNKGSITIVGCDDSEKFNDSNILCNTSSVLSIRSRNPKRNGVGPSVSLEGGVTNSADSINAYTTYGSVKGIPASPTVSNTYDKSGGQLVFMTTPVEESIPIEALRINENQQVCLGTSSYSDENLYTCGNVYISDSVGISSRLYSTKAQVTTFTSTDTVTDNLVILGESWFDGSVHIVSSQVAVAISKATLTEQLQVSRSSNMTGLVNITGQLTVNGIGTFNGTTDMSSTLVVNNNTVLKESLDVDDEVVFHSEVNVESPLTVNDETTLESNLNIQDSLTVSGTSVFENAVGISTSFDVTGDTILESDLSIDGSLTVNSSSTFNDPVIANSTVDINYRVFANDDVSITGSNSKIYNTSYTDPDSGVSRSLKISGTGLAVNGGTNSDTVTCYSSSSGTSVTPVEVYAPNNTNSDDSTEIFFGVDDSFRNGGVLGFKYTASGSTSNKVVLQFIDDSHDLLTLRADHTASIDKLTVNGDITVSGKVLPTDIVSTVSLTNIALPTSDTNLQYGERIRLWGTGTLSGYSVGIAPNVLWLTSPNTVAFYSSGTAVASVTSTGFNGVYPVGSVIWAAFNCVNGSQGQTTVPIGYLVCNGAQVSRTTYATLFAVIGTIYGSGDNSTTFNIPDLRGAFIRGYNNTSSGYDPNRNFGSSQSDAVRSHNHSIGIDAGGAHTHGYLTPTTAIWQSGSNNRGGGYKGWQATEEEPAHSHNASSNSRGSETKPCNYAMVGLIRYA